MSLEMSCHPEWRGVIPSAVEGSPSKTTQEILRLRPYGAALRMTFLFLLLFSPSATHAQAARYYTKSEVLAYLYPKSEKIGFEKKILTTAQIASVTKSLKSKNVPADWTVYTATTRGKTDGYVIIDDVIGKEESITYAVSIAPDGAVREVEILIYRESHGAAVKNKSFRSQFVGKRMGDSLRVGQDIQNVSGATISSRSIAFGVKRALAVWREFYGK